MLRGLIATNIGICSYDTGYSVDFLLDRIRELEEDGESLEEAANHVIVIAYELDYWYLGERKEI